MRATDSDGGVCAYSVTTRNRIELLILHRDAWALVTWNCILMPGTVLYSVVVVSSSTQAELAASALGSQAHSSVASSSSAPCCHRFAALFASKAFAGAAQRFFPSFTGHHKPDRYTAPAGPDVLPCTARVSSPALHLHVVDPCALGIAMRMCPWTTRPDTRLGCRQLARHVAASSWVRACPITCRQTRGSFFGVGPALLQN
jgi:hypothetical protein